MFWLIICAVVSMSQLFGALPEREPWLSSFLDVSLGVDQSHTQSSKVDTKKGTRNLFCHSEKTSLRASGAPLRSCNVVTALNLTRTQSKAYGFDSLSLGGQYAFFNDLEGDILSLTAGAALSVSPSSRICDLSSQNHSPFEAKTGIACGKEFGYSDTGFFRAAVTGCVGKGTRGAVWVGASAFIQRVCKQSHYLSLFFESERGLSSHRLSSIDHFRGWATVGYAFGDIGVRYEFYKSWIGVFYSEVKTRVFAHDALSHSLGLQIGIQIPISLF